MPGKEERIKKGIRSAALTSAAFCAVISILVFVFAGPLMQIFIDPGDGDPCGRRAVFKDRGRLLYRDRDFLSHKK